jgi:hypothetical protein
MTRCVVVESRTELDWAMRHDGISVWAPSKLVLDAVHGPEGHVTAPLALAHWLAGAFEARLRCWKSASRARMPAGVQIPANRVADRCGGYAVGDWLPSSA